MAPSTVLRSEWLTVEKFGSHHVRLVVHKASRMCGTGRGWRWSSFVAGLVKRPQMVYHSKVFDHLAG